MSAAVAPRLTRRPRLRRIARELIAACDPAASGWLIVALGLVLAGAVAAGLAPLALKSCIDELAAEAGARQLPQSLTLYVSALAVQKVCEQAQAFAYGLGEQRISRRLAVRGFRHLLGLPLGYHLATPSGATQQTLNEALLGVRQVLTHVALTLLPTAVQIAIAAVALSTVCGSPVALVLLSALAAYGLAFGWGISRLQRAATIASAAQIEASGLSADGLMNVEPLKAYSAESRFADRYDRQLADRERQARVLLGRRLQNGLLVSVIFGCTVAATLVMEGRAVLDARLSLGGFVLINAYLLQLVRPLELLGFAARDMAQGIAGLDRLLQLLAMDAEATQPLSALAPAAEPADLRFERVSFAFVDGRPTLQDVSFHAPPGSLVAVVGPSGSGKSSLLRLIMRFHEPTGGRILFDGRPIGSLSLSRLRGDIALVGQDTILLNDTIAANIAMAVNDASPEAITQAAQAARLTDLVADLPLGLQTLVGERGLALSGGEKQRIAIARAALKRARLVILDEATAALDPATERDVWAAMRQVARGSTTLVVTHRLATTVDADEILVLDKGRILERGTHPELLAAGGLYAGLWRVQA